MKIFRKSKEKILCSLYPIHMPFELFLFTSLPSLHCKIELNCLSFSNVGHLAVWPCSAANEGIDHRADEMLMRCLHWVPPAEPELLVAREGAK